MLSRLGDVAWVEVIRRHNRPVLPGAIHGPRNRIKVGSWISVWKARSRSSPVSLGIGLACATSLLAEGARVLGTSRSAPTTIAGLTHVQLDMTKPGAAERAVEESVARLGSLDILVNNVGSGRLSTGFADESDAHWAEVFELNLMTAIRTTRAALPHLVEGGGVVVNVFERERSPSEHVHLRVQRRQGSDGQSHRWPFPRSSHAAACACECGPGPVNTPLWLGPTGVAATVAARAGSDPQKVVDEAIAEIPIGRFTTPEEVADLVAFLASARAGTITGTTIRIDGGITPSV